MRWGAIASAWVACAAVVVGLSGETRADETSEKDIARALDSYQKAYNDRKVDDLMAFWAKDADFIDHRGRSYKGRDAVADLFRKALSSDRKYQIKLNVTSRKFLSPDLAMDDGELELLESNGDVERGRYITVWGKVDGKWLIRSVRDIPVEPTEQEVAAPSLDGLEWLVGDWMSDSKEAPVKLTTRWRADKKFLMQEYEAKTDDKSFSVTVFIGWDPVNRHVRSWFFDSTGGYGQGAWQQREKKWVASSNGVLPDGRIGSSIFSWTMTDENTLDWSATEREVDGQAIPDTAVKFVRVKAAPKGDATKPAAR